MLTKQNTDVYVLEPDVTFWEHQLSRRQKAERSLEHSRRNPKHRLYREQRKPRKAPHLPTSLLIQKRRGFTFMENAAWWVATLGRSWLWLPGNLAVHGLLLPDESSGTRSGSVTVSDTDMTWHCFLLIPKGLLRCFPSPDQLPLLTLRLLFTPVCSFCHES